MKSDFGVREALLLALLALIWGHSFLFIKTAVSVVAPPWVVTARMAIGGLLLGALMWWRREPSPRDASMLAKLGIAGVFGSALPWAAQAWAQHFLDSGLVAVLNACTPLVTLLMAVASGQERLARRRVGGIAIAILGTLLVVRGEVGMGRSVLALSVAVLATVGYAFGAVYTRAHISGRVRSLPAAALQLAIGALVLAPIAGAVYGAPPSALPASVVWSLLALGLLGTGISFLIYFTLLERVGATNTSMVTYLVPVVATAAGAVYRGERFGTNVMAGGAALIFGVWLAQGARRAAVPLPRHS